MAMPPKTPVYADYYRLKQCMINLISNALAYTPGGGHIAVEYRMREGHVEIKVGRFTLVYLRRIFTSV